LIVSSKGKYVNSIDKTTNILVVGENPGNKLDLAKQLDLIIIKEADLI
jgi:NAD-dependent DNA ligase